MVGASLAALLAGCGGSSEKTYKIDPTEQCLRSHREHVVRNPRGPVLALNFAYLRFDPSVADAKAFDVSKLNTNFGGYDFHRKRYGNVSLVWATGGPANLTGPTAAEVKDVERCLHS